MVPFLRKTNGNFYKNLPFLQNFIKFCLKFEKKFDKDSIKILILLKYI